MLQTYRNQRQQVNDTDDPEFAEKEKENQEEEEEEEGNMLTGLISAFLGGLSKVSDIIITMNS